MIKGGFAVAAPALPHAVRKMAGRRGKEEGEEDVGGGEAVFFSSPPLPTSSSHSVFFSLLMTDHLANAYPEEESKGKEGGPRMSSCYAQYSSEDEEEEKEDQHAEDLQYAECAKQAESGDEVGQERQILRSGSKNSRFVEDNGFRIMLQCFLDEAVAPFVNQVAAAAAHQDSENGALFNQLELSTVTAAQV